MATTSELDEPVDGRTARAVRTRDAIVEATLGLIDEGDLRPTGPRIAERAGVSVRSIFQHFDDLDALFSAVGAKVVARIAGLIRAIDPASPLDDRIESMVAQRAEVLEVLSPVLRAALVHAASSSVIQQQFESGHGFFRTQVGEVFAPELAASSHGDQLRASLVAALSWPTWDLLRRAEGLSIDGARAVVEWSVRSSLAAGSGGS